MRGRRGSEVGADERKTLVVLALGSAMPLGPSICCPRFNAARIGTTNVFMTKANVE